MCVCVGEEIFSLPGNHVAIDHSEGEGMGASNQGLGHHNEIISLGARCLHL